MEPILTVRDLSLCGELLRDFMEELDSAILTVEHQGGQGSPDKTARRSVLKLTTLVSALSTEYNTLLEQRFNEHMADLGEDDGNR